MMGENLIRNCRGAVFVRRGDDRLLEVIHDLKNCMNVLLLCVENLEADVGRSAPDQQSRETLYTIVHEMNSLVEELVKLAGK
jgi:hypothetical protein